MKTIVLHKWENYNAVNGWDQKRGFSLDNDFSFEFVGDIAEKEYVLPEGFELAESNAGSLEIYKGDKLCSLTGSQNPVLRWDEGALELRPV